jgi:hypothetical protein
VNQGMWVLVMIVEFLFLCISYLSLLYFSSILNTRTVLIPEIGPTLVGMHPCEGLVAY